MKKLINIKFNLRKKDKNDEMKKVGESTKENPQKLSENDMETDGIGYIVDKTDTIDKTQEHKKIDKSKSTKEEIAELLKPIAVHEAKSAFYKAKLVTIVVAKGAEVTAKTSKKVYESWKAKKSSN